MAFPAKYKITDNLVLWLSSFYDGLTSPIDLTSATSDYELSVGEVAKITISAASTPLNIAVEDGVYEIDLSFDPTTFSADRVVQLDINNAAQTGLVAFNGYISGTVIATDEFDASDATTDSHRFIGIVASIPDHAWGRLIIRGSRSSFFAETKGQTLAGDTYLYKLSTRFGNAPHTSLGTLQIGEAATGVCYVKRIA